MLNSGVERYILSDHIKRRFFVKTRLLVPVLLLLAGMFLSAGEMPEFGKSVQFDKDQFPVSIAALKGKVVLVLFYQEW